MFSRIRMALDAAFKREIVESEMDKEMRLHLEMETEANIQRGMSPDEARRVALVAFGGMNRAKEDTRDQRSTRWLEEIGADLRYAGRSMRQRPGFTIAIVFLLALGIGANTAIYSVVDEMLWRRFPVPGGDRIVTLAASAAKGQFQLPTTSDMVDLWRSRARRVEDIIVFRAVDGMVGDSARGRRDVGGGETAPGLAGAQLGPGMMGFLSMEPTLGRDIIASDTLDEAPRVLILGNSLWRREYGARPEVIGSTVPVDGVPHVVIGVAPPKFFVPFTYSAKDFFVAVRHSNKPRPLEAVGRIRAGYSLAEASREAASVDMAFSTSPFRIDGLKLNDGASLVRPIVRRIALMLFGAVCIVLLVACANVANLLLARAWGRQREFAVRGAMGANRGRIARQLLTEHLVLGLLGGIAGFLLATVLIKVIVGAQPDNVGFGGRLDFHVLGWAIGAALVTGAVLALAPIALIGDGRLNEMLKSSARSTTSSVAARRFRSTLVVAEVALSVVLLAGAGLLIRSIVAMQRADVGLRPEGLASIYLRFPENDYARSQPRDDAAAAIIARLRQTPGIESAALAIAAPPGLGASLRGNVEIEGRAVTPADSLGVVSFNQGTEGFFRVAGIRFIAGRPYSASSAHTEVVVNQRFARRYWPDGALGHRIKIDSTWATIVGIVADLEIPGEKAVSQLQHYRAMRFVPPYARLIVRSTLPVPAIEAVVTNAVKEVAPRVRVSQFKLAQTQFVEARATTRFTLGLVAAFAGLTLLLAAIGLGAVIGYSVSQRMREIGIRICLGAQSTEVAALVCRQGVALATAGVVVGSVVALGATRVMRSMLYGVTPGDPITTVTVAALLIVVALIACALPAGRATRVDPVEMVRAE
jgi:predicted permease